jgi:PAS domain S-box-containing protein
MKRRLAALFNVTEWSLHPIKLLGVGVGLTILLCALLATAVWTTNRALVRIARDELRLRTLSDTIAHLDEVLTMSARMAAATGDTHWEDRYQRFEPQLAAAIEGAIRLAPEGTEDAAVQIYVANAKLVAMENRAFSLVNQEQREAASALLSSTAYEEQKQIYAEGVGRTIAVIQNNIEALIALQERRLVEVGVAATASLAVLAAVWLTILTLMKRYLAERRRTESQVRRLNAELEQRVLTRTAQLKQSEQQLQGILDNATAVVYVKDIQGRYLLINSRFESLFAVTKDNVLQRTDHDIFPDDMADAFRANDKAVLEANAPLEFDEVAPHPDGPHTYISIKFPLYDATETPYAVCGISTDITARRRAEEQVRRHEATLAHVLRVNSMGEMAAGLAHEINQPLAAIANYTNASLRRLASGTAQSAELVQMMQKTVGAALRAGEIVRHLRDFVAKREPQCELADLNDVVRGVAQLMEAEVRRCAVALRLDLASELPTAQVDRIQIEQVLVNLMRNGLEAISGATTNHGMLSVGTSLASHGAIEVTVTDTGSGLLAADTEKVFEPFFTTKTHSLGMGLTISRTIVEAHGGRLWAVGNPAGGTTFGFSLPSSPGGYSP